MQQLSSNGAGLAAERGSSAQAACVHNHQQLEDNSFNSPRPTDTAGGSSPAAEEPASWSTQLRSKIAANRAAGSTANWLCVERPELGVAADTARVRLGPRQGDECLAARQCLPATAALRVSLQRQGRSCAAMQRRASRAWSWRRLLQHTARSCVAIGRPSISPASSSQGLRGGTAASARPALPPRQFSAKCYITYSSRAAVHNELLPAPLPPPPYGHPPAGW